MNDQTAGKWEELAAELDRGGDDAVDRLAAAVLANPAERAAPFLMRALEISTSESSKRAAATALAVAAAPDDVDAVEALEAAYRAARLNASLGPALLKVLGLYALRCATARPAAISAVQRLKVTDSAYLLIAAAKVAALLLGQQDDTGLRQKLSGLLASDDPDVQSEAHYQLAFLSLTDAFQAETHEDVLAGLKRASAGFATAIDLVDFRPDASLVGLLVDLVLQFDALDEDRQAGSASIAGLAKRLRAEVGGMGERVFQGYKSTEAVRFGQKAVEIAEALEAAASEVAEAARWTNFDRSVVRLAECVGLIRARPEAALGVGRVYEGLGRIADCVVKPRLGPVLMRKVGRESLAQVAANYRRLHGEDEIAAALVILQEAEREAELGPGTRLSEEKAGKLAALAAKVNLSPDELVDEIIVVVREDQGHGWAVKAGLLPQLNLSEVQGAGGMSKVDVVLVTVNEHETDAVLLEFEAATGSKAEPVSRDGRVYLNLGTINGTTVFHALSEMGSGGVGGMQQTVDMAIRSLDPGAVIAVGIAFGVNEGKQSIGDILLSKQLRLYDLQRYGKEISLRGDKPAGSIRLLNHFKTFTRTRWKGSEVRDGVILSGDKLIDDIDYRDQLVKLESEAIGGEMEGSGLYVSSHEHKVDWIVVKAICDWADGDKRKNKTARQKKAAQNAAEFVRRAIEYAPLNRPARAGGGGPPAVADAALTRQTIQLTAKLESVNVKYVDPDVSVGGARAELRARFRVTNAGDKTARVWNVRIEILPSNPQMNPYFLEMPNEDSTEPILPRGSKVKNVEFAFRIMNSPVPIPFAFRSLLVSQIRFWTASEDGEGEAVTMHISEAPDADRLIETIESHLRNKLGWRS